MYSMSQEDNVNSYVEVSSEQTYTYDAIANNCISSVSIKVRAGEADLIHVGHATVLIVLQVSRKLTDIFTLVVIVEI